ncbi:cobalamin-dependent protein [Candidatus Woesearchaeota archaeon]|nr:cobalamin-dependent protein [Candidatus Woesearchaeota archaeon]
MSERHVALVSYANVSYGGKVRGPVPSGLMLEGTPHLAGRLLKEGYIPRIFDFNSVRGVRRLAESGSEAYEKECAQEIISYAREHEAKLVGFTLYSNGFKGTVRIAEMVRETLPGIFIMGGGPLTTWVEKAIFRYTDAFDVLCIGEGDLSLPRTADSIYDGSMSFSDAPNLLFKDGSRTRREVTNISELPFPTYDPQFYPDIKHKIQIPVCRGSVGCRYGQCSFCIQPKTDGPFRIRNIDNLLQEIYYLKEEHSFSRIRLSDPNPPPKEMVRIAEGIESRFPGQMKVSSFNYADALYNFEKTKKIQAGAFVGIESFDFETLLKLNKTRNPEKYVRDATSLIETAKKQGIPSVVAIIVPVANDTIRRIEYDYNMVKELNPDFVVGVALGPLPGTQDYFSALNLGEESGIRLSPDYEHELMLWELDLLQPPSAWSPPPWELKVDGKFCGNPFLINHKHFLGKLIEEGFEPVADEIVLMADLFYNGLPTEQNERRQKIIHFNKEIRKSIATSDYESLEKIVTVINHNQKSSLRR